MFLENIHRQMKHEYLGGKTCKRLDEGIYILLKLTRDKSYERMIKISKKARSRKVQEIIKSHNRSEGVKVEIFPEESEKWLAYSETTENMVYEVLKVLTSDYCGKCALFWEKCKVCEHVYTCTCADILMKANMCKHIHACIKQQTFWSESSCNEIQSAQAIVLTENPSIPVFSISNEYLKESPNNFDCEMAKCYRIIGALRISEMTSSTRLNINKHLDAILTAVEGNKKLSIKENSNKRKAEKQSRPFKIKIKIKRENLFQLCQQYIAI